MKHIELLQRCHDILRGVSIHTPTGVVKPGVDEVAKEITDYLNHASSHFQGCWSHGPSHYMCACSRIKQLERELAELND